MMDIYCNVGCAVLMGLLAFVLVPIGGGLGAWLALAQMRKKENVNDKGLAIIGALHAPAVPARWARGSYKNKLANWLYHLGFDVVQADEKQVIVRGTIEEIEDELKKSKQNSP